MAIKTLVSVGALALALSNASLADDMAGMDMSKPMGDQSASSKAFAGANAKMHKDMAVTYSGNADADFAHSMIPHHQGAIDMARIELQYGKDPEMRKLAEAVVSAQEAEIAEMNAWLQKYGNK